MKAVQKIALLTIVVLIFVFSFLKNKPKEPSVADSNQQVVQEFKAKITISDGPNTKIFEAENFVGKTVLEATTSNSSVETEGRGTMAFVTSINGHKADNNKKEFWEMVVNGKQAEVGAGTYVIKSGDQIEWKLSTY